MKNTYMTKEHINKKYLLKNCFNTEDWTPLGKFKLKVNQSVFNNLEQSFKTFNTQDLRSIDWFSILDPIYTFLYSNKLNYEYLESYYALLKYDINKILDWSVKLRYDELTNAYIVSYILLNNIDKRIVDKEYIAMTKSEEKLSYLLNIVGSFSNRDIALRSNAAELVKIILAQIKNTSILN